jgi:hypothetical protein
MTMETYLCTRSVTSAGEILLEMQEWETRLNKEGILNLLEIPHFRHSLEINACVKVVLSCIHGWTLWLDPPMSIDIELIVWITRLPKSREDLTILFNKIGERSLSEAMKEKFHTFRGGKGTRCEKNQ